MHHLLARRVHLDRRLLRVAQLAHNVMPEHSRHPEILFAPHVVLVRSRHHRDPPLVHYAPPESLETGIHLHNVTLVNPVHFQAQPVELTARRASPGL